MTYTRQTLREAVQSALRDFDDCGPELSAAYADAAIAAMLDRLRKPDDMLFAAVASAISRNIRLEWRGHDDAIIPQHSVFEAADAALKAILDASEKERSDGRQLAKNNALHANNAWVSDALPSAYERGFWDGAEEQRQCDPNEKPHKDCIGEGYQNWLSDNLDVCTALQETER